MRMGEMSSCWWMERVGTEREDAGDFPAQRSEGESWGSRE